MPPTPQYRWPGLSRRAGCEVWVKHENHTPTGAFKVRGGLVLFDELHRSGQLPRKVITATRGNHGQSIPFAASRFGVPVTVLAPRGNSVEKNAAMVGWGADLVEFGDDLAAACPWQLKADPSCVSHPPVEVGHGVWSSECQPGALAFAAGFRRTKYRRTR